MQPAGSAPAEAWLATAVAAARWLLAQQAARLLRAAEASAAVHSSGLPPAARCRQHLQERRLRPAGQLQVTEPAVHFALHGLERAGKGAGGGSAPPDVVWGERLR